MKIHLSCGFLWLILIANSPYTLADSDRFLGPRDIRGIKATIDGYVKHKESIFQYGNWYGPGWWGGAKDAKPGNKAPVDSLDIIAQRHDFAYQVAEQQGKIYGIAEEKRLKSIADYFAVRDAKALPENPKQWRYPPAEPDKASRYRDRMVTGFSYEAPAYEGVSIAGKGLDWATSPIENWELDKSNQLNAADLEKQVNSLQSNWNSKNLPPVVTPTNPEQAKATEKTVADKTDNNNPAPVTSPTNTEQQKVTPDKNNSEPEKTDSDHTATPENLDKPTDKNNTEADQAELEKDPDYIELMKLSNEMMSLANQAMAEANAGKIPSNSTVNRITALQVKISALSKRLEGRYSKKYLGNNKTDNQDNKDQDKQNTGDRGGTVYNKDGSKDVLHYEKDPDGKEVAVWTTYDKNGQITKKRREK